MKVISMAVNRIIFYGGSPDYFKEVRICTGGMPMIAEDSLTQKRWLA